MSNKKKITTAVVAVAAAATLLLGGTFAWQSINQTALNEASAVINPGGRLHDDFNGSNKDVYVENFAEDPIFARVRLDEYFEIVMNKGTGAEKTEIVTTGATKGDTATYVTHIFGDVNATDEYWEWATGGKTVYMPTFNKDKDSLDADINGTYAGPDGDESTPDDAYLDYETATEAKTAEAVYDADTDNLPDGEKKYVMETHEPTNTLGATLMSMQKWIDEGSNPGAYWVYDTDGWVYWAQAIQPDTATGLLLDGIELAQVMDDSWYYAINVVAQFVTADDLGRGTNTGFYDLDKGTAPTPEALELLEKIGVDTTSVVEDDTALREALAAGGNVKIDGTIDSTTTETKDDINFNYDYLWHDGGTLSGGTLNLYTGSNRGLFINNEINWPETGDGANEATLKDITINANSVAAVYVQAIDAPVNLKNVKITSDNAGIYVNMGGETVTLDNVTIDAANNDTREGEDWFNTAVVVATPGNVVINSGSYTGDNAVYVLSSGGTVTINGGYFDGALKADAGTITITGGTFTADPTEFVDLSTYAVVTNEDGTYTVKEIGGDAGFGDSSEDETYDLLLTADGTNSANVVTGDSIKIKVEDGIVYDRIRIMEIYSDGETNESSADMTSDGLLLITMDKSDEKIYKVLAQSGTEVYDEEYDEYYTDYTTVASAKLNVSYAYEFRYNDTAVKDAEISISAGDFVTKGITFSLWDTVENAAADEADYAQVTKYVLSYYSDGMDGELFGMYFDEDTRTLKITTTETEYDGEAVELKTGNKFVISLCAEKVFLDTEDETIKADLTSEDSFTITIS